MRRFTVVSSWMVACLLAASRVEAGCVVALQPLGEVSQEFVATARAALAEFWGAEVQVLPARPLPRAAWYEPRHRWRAERLIEWLGTLELPGDERVVGLTASDISTTKDDAPDWGIFGLGELGGRACVVSTYRLKGTFPTAERSRQRLVKVLNHELGHTFGLDHCATSHCLMADARGTIATVDAEPGELCDSCRRRAREQGLRAGERALEER